MRLIAAIEPQPRKIGSFIEEKGEKWDHTLSSARSALDLEAGCQHEPVQMHAKFGIVLFTRVVTGGWRW